MCTVIDVAAGRTTPWLLRLEAVSSGGRGGRIVNIRLEAEPRSDFGKGAARRLRRSGRIPVVLYGSGTELVHLSLPGHDLEQALRKPKVTLEIVQGSATTLAKPRDVQRDPVRRSIEHVDLIVVTASEARDRAAEAEVLVAEAAAAAEAAASAPAPKGPSEESVIEAAAAAAESAESADSSGDES
jgi:ribosomal protein L25 (general stress protein Ctc)